MSGHYRSVTLDDSPQLLAMSFRLRYQAYCVERQFFSQDQYPNQMESDAFDRASVHVGVLDADNELVGTGRVVRPNSAGLPLLRHCTLFPHVTTLADPSNTVVELSRVCINHRWNRRTTTMAISHPDRRAPVTLPPALPDAGQGSNDISATLLKGMYQATKRLGGTHWIIAVEKGLRRRLVAHFRMPFREVGPEVDYHGPVAPYVLSMAELDDVIRARKYPVLNDFPVGLEPDFWPTPVRQTSGRSLEARI
jgi:N-acyl amino acid synthase of PEP-CTERM/exosortase system